MIRTLQGIRKNFVKQNGLLFLSHKNKCNENSFLLFISALIFSCGNNSGNAAKMFCDTACQKDTIKFIKEDHELKPYIFISAANCLQTQLSGAIAVLVLIANFHLMILEDISST
jgi:hypothetical protein